MQRFDIVATLRNETDGDEGLTGKDTIRIIGQLPFEPTKGLWIEVVTPGRAYTMFKVYDVTWKIEINSGGTHEYFEIEAEPPEMVCTTKTLVDAFNAAGWSAAVIKHDPPDRKPQ